MRRAREQQELVRLAGSLLVGGAAKGCTASQQAVVPDDTPKPQQYQWYWQCRDETVEYPADVRDRLEKAHTEFKAGRGRRFRLYR